MPRENANGARAKSGGRTVPAGPELIRLYADYLHGEYGGIDSDYVFINIWAEPRGQAWSYPAAYDLVMRLRAKTGLARILDAHPELPAIAWMVGPAGCVLAGRVGGLAPSWQVRDVFTAWQAALGLGDYREQASGGASVFLHAAARRHGVKVRLITTVFDDEQDSR